MKSLDDGIARRYSRNGLVNRVGDFSLLQSYIAFIHYYKNTGNILVHYPLFTFQRIYGVNVF